MKNLLILLPFLLGGCQTVGDFADDMGSHMPVVGERCEHWQCFTASGRSQSEMNKRARAGASAGAPAAPPPTSPASPPMPEAKEDTSWF